MDFNNIRLLSTNWNIVKIGIIFLVTSRPVRVLFIGNLLFLAEEQTK